jgi:hypothetical protein
MPAIAPDDDIGIGFDMHGCPNRCRHCWMGHQVVATPRTPRRGADGASPLCMSEEDVRWAVAQFRAFRRPGENRAPWKRLRVATWMREPDYSDDYRHLHALETELSDVAPPRATYELLSVWRLARDPDYAHWAYGLGMRACQLTFFGMEKATDWGCRRRGAFPDLLIATERLLAAGIRPRWQLIFTKVLIPDLPELIALAEELRLRERCEALGGPFTFWMHLPTSDGAALSLDSVWPTERDLDRVPRDFLEHCEAHTQRPIGLPERALLPRLRDDPGPAVRSVSAATSGNAVWFYIAPGFDVYTSFSAISPAFRLGNVKADGVAAIIDAWEHDRTVGLQAMFCTPNCELARRYGRPYSRKLYDTDDLQWRWAAMAAKEAET